MGQARSLSKKQSAAPCRLDGVGPLALQAIRCIARRHANMPRRASAKMGNIATVVTCALGPQLSESTTRTSVDTTSDPATATAAAPEVAAAVAEPQPRLQPQLHPTVYHCILLVSLQALMLLSVGAAVPWQLRARRAQRGDVKYGCRDTWRTLIGRPGFNFALFFLARSKGIGLVADHGSCSPDEIAR